MQTYHIHCAFKDQTQIKSILRRHNDVIINQTDESSIGITIEKDNPEADEYYKKLLELINRELHLALH
jgi:hypothetical protein